MKSKLIINSIKLLIGAAAVLLSSQTTFAQTTLAKWNFESLIFSTAYTNAVANGWCTNIPADIGTGTFSGFHTKTTTPYSTVAGNGSAKSITANNWTNNPGDFWQFAVSTMCFGYITVSYDQVGSGSGPGKFNLQYSTDGVNFITFSNYTLPSSITSWSASAPNAGSSLSFDLSAVTTVTNLPLVYFRVVDASTTSVNGGTVGTSGTGRIDNVAVLGSVPGPAAIIGDPQNTSVNYGDSVTLSATVNGTPPIYYQWFYFTNGATTTNILADGPNGFGPGTISGSTNSSLTLTLVDTNQAGNYFVVATNVFNTPATSQVAQLNVILRAPIVTNIAYLHTLHNANYVVTDTTNLYQVEGIVTTSGDLVSAGGQSAYFQDASGAGMDLFFFAGTAGYSLPNIGDHIRVTGQLAQFDGALEIDLTADPAHSLVVLDSGNPLPAPRPFDFSHGIDPNAMEGYISGGTTVVPAIEGSYVVISNVFLGITNVNQTDLLQPDQVITATNLTGQKFSLHVPNNSLVQTTFTPLPGTFAKSIKGVMAQIQTTGTVLTNNYQIYYDLQSNIELGNPPAPAPKISSIALTPDGIVVSGTNNNGTTAGNYAVLVSTNLALPVSQWTAISTQSYSGDGSLSFTNPVGTDTQQFYLLQVVP